MTKELFPTFAKASIFTFAILLRPAIAKMHNYEQVQEHLL
jgi:hypothetical protein